MAKVNVLQYSDKQKLKILEDVAVELMETHSLHDILSLILNQASSLMICDAGSIYIKHGEDQLMFEAAVNHSKKIDIERRVIPAVGKGLAVYCYNTGQPLTVDDAYTIDPSAPYQFDISFDKKMNYRTKSLLVYPLKNRRGEMLGVLQLINRKRNLQEMWPQSDSPKIKEMPAFTSEDMRLLRSFSALASAALENSFLYEDIEKLFEGFVYAAVNAIESRDFATKGHSERVAELTTDLATKVSRSEDYALKSVRFNDNQMREIRYASLLHDFGKIGVKESTLLKEKKLYPDQLQEIQTRITELAHSQEIKQLREFIGSLQKDKTLLNELQIKRLDTEISKYKQSLRQHWQEILELNEPSVLDEDKAAALHSLRELYFEDLTGASVPLLREDEIFRLSITRGTLSDEERREVEGHVSLTYKFLKQIPWSKGLKNIPEIAYAHHEKLDGSGYPRTLNSKKIPIQSQLMTICDIFDALVAADRPYKKSLPAQRAIEILESDVNRGKLNKSLFKIFLEGKVYESSSFMALLNKKSRAA